MISIVRNYSLSHFAETGQKILKLLCRGKTKQEIIATLSIGESTYRKYLSDFRIYFELREIHQIVIYCRQHQYF